MKPISGFGSGGSARLGQALVVLLSVGALPWSGKLASMTDWLLGCSLAGFLS